MFKLQTADEITETVKFKLPKGNGKADQFNIKVTFVRHTTTKIKERQDMFADNVINVKAGMDANPDCDDKMMLREDVRNIEGVVDPDSEEKMPFDDDLLENLMDIPELLTAMMLKWAEVNYGQNTVKVLNRKNA